MKKTRDQQTGAESKTQLAEQANVCLRSGDYTRALDLLRGAAAKFPKDPELSGLEKLAHEGVKRSADANRLITESQELFAQQKSADAIQLLRRAYDLDKNNPLARAILANALVEHAHSVVETDWLEAEKLSNQALALNPAHPTAKTIRNLIVDLKPTISVDDWVAKVRKLQSAGDLFAALTWVAEGLAVHPDHPKLLQVQDAIQRDQGARRRQARRRDLKDLRRMELEIDQAADSAAKQALADRIQAVAAKYWTDGEFLSIANTLLERLGLIQQKSSTASPHSKAATVIFCVPRPSPPRSSPAETSQIPGKQFLQSEVRSPALPSSAPPDASPVPAPSGIVPAVMTLQNQVAQRPVPQKPAPRNQAAPVKVPPSKVPPSKVPSPSVLPGKAPTAPPEPQLPVPTAATVSTIELSAAAAKATSLSSSAKQPATWNSTTLMLASSCAAVIVVAAIFFLAPKPPRPTLPKAPATAPIAPTPAVPAPVVSRSPASAPEQTASTPATSSSEQTTSEPSSPLPSDASIGKGAPSDQPPAGSARNLGTLVVVAGQDDAKVFLNGKLQRQLTQAGQLRVPNLEVKDYAVRVSKSGFQDPPQQRIRIPNGEEARLVFNLQPQPSVSSRPASLIIQGGTPGTAVFVDQAPVGTVRQDGTLSLSTVNPGDHAVELRKDRFKARQYKKHFVAGETIALTAADAALEAAPGELTITFTPPDTRVAIVKDGLLKMVSSGVPLNLAAGSYTLTARSVDGFTSSSALEISGGQSRTLNLSLAPTGMSNWEDPGAWKHEKDSFIRRGGDFVLYGVAPTAGTFVFSGMIAKGHLLQWVLNYTDPKNYVLFQMDDNNLYRTVIRNGQKTNAIKVADKGDKKAFRTLHIRVSPTEIVHQVKHGDTWTIVDRWTQPGANLSQGKFGFYIPGDDQVALSNFAHHADLNLR